MAESVKCAHCKVRILPGDRTARDGQGWLVCEDCAREEGL
jgi:hypothetical protein